MTDEITKRDLENELEQLRTNVTGITFDSSVTVITEDMVNTEGNTTESVAPDPDPPDGFELGNRIPTESAVVTIYIDG